jgi:hypothetical protein
MARATQIPTGFSFRHKFEELPLFWLYTGGEAWRGARLDGEFEISADGPGDWWISDLWISLDNGKIGPEAKGSLVNLNADDDERFYLLVLDAIDHKYASYIEERIADEMPAAPMLSLVA